MTHPIVAEISAFNKEHVLGREKYFDDAEQMPPLPEFREMAKRKLLHWWIPEKYGGRGISFVDTIDIVAELAYAEGGIGSLMPPTVLCSMQLVMWGTEDQKERYLRPMAEQGTFAAMVGSEEAAGSELLRLATTATRDGDDYIINGDKYFSTNADHADYWVVLARSKDNPSFKSLIVPRNTPGAIVVKRWSSIGVRACPIYQLRFENCRVAARDILPVHGLRALEGALNPSRVMLAACAVGGARRVRDVCMAYAKEKELKKSTLVKNNAFIAKMGQMEMEIEAMYLVAKAAAREVDEATSTEEGRKKLLKTGTIKQALVAKMLGGQLGYKVAEEGSKMFGGFGYTEESIIGKLVRDLRLVAIMEAGEDPIREMIFHRYVPKG
jgi:alkylation response protein AidB-like acyl-CoA dehydrogenase